MANDSTNAGAPSAHDTAPTNDSYFTDMQGEDAFFGPEQLAQANPEKVAVPPDQNVIRVQVNPGEIIQLSSPFDSDAALLAREGDGNLAIKVGDVTVILQGYVDANQQAPVVVETSDGKPIDIATLLASTDPTIDIQTAAGPGDNGAAGGQGADNTGAILSQLEGGAGLGGLNAVGTQDQTALKYGLIDNSIRLDRDDTLLALAAAGFKGLNEPFLRDPAHTNSALWLSFDDFRSEYAQYIDDHKAANGGWADFTGTQADNSDSAAFFLKTSFTLDVPHSSTSPQQLNLLVGPAFFNGAVPTSNGETLVAEYLGGNPGDKSTIVLVRPSDGAVVMVFHVVETESTGDFHVEVYLVNRLDHHAEGPDSLSVGFNTELYQPPAEGEESQGTTAPGPSASVDVLDDIPLAGAVEYTSYLGKDVDKSEESEKKTSGHDSIDTTAQGKGFVDEDWAQHGNKDYDNDPSGANSDPAHGDDIGRATAIGNLNINFGADGPAGADGNEANFLLGAGSTLTLKLDASFEAGFVDKDGHVLDAQGNVLTSGGHELVILSDTVDANGVEHLVVGYEVKSETPLPDARTSDLIFAVDSEGGSGDVVVFKLTLDVNPDDHSGNMQFQDFKFELCKALDQDPNTPTVESNTDLVFKVVGHDDDGDTVNTAINIQVNDDSPVFKITYNNEDPTNCDWGGGGNDVSSLSVGGGGVHVGHFTTHDFGHVDEDWLNGDQVITFKSYLGPDNAGNHDRDAFYQDNANLFGDEKGGTEVCGQINIKYGADGPADTPDNGKLGLDEYSAPPAGQNYVEYQNPDGTHFTQNGEPLVVLYSSDTRLVVGTAVEQEGDGGNVIVETPVFCLELDPATGKFDFHLLGAIDHDPVSGPNGEPETDLTLTFNVGTAEDGDHDKAVGAINIKVNDDHPEVGISYCNEDPQNGSEGVYTTHRFDTDFGRVDEDWLTDGACVTNGGFEVDPVIGNFKTLSGPDGLTGWTIGGAGIDLINAYWPGSSGAPGDQSVDLNALKAGSISTEISGLTVGKTYTISFDLGGNPDIQNGPKPISVDVAGVHQEYIVDTTGHSLPDVNFQHQSFTFVATSTTETLTFTSTADGPCGPVLDNVAVTPINGVGNQDLDANGDSDAGQFGDDYGSTHLSGQIVMKYGADGPGTQTLGLNGLVALQAATDADGNPLTTQHGTIPLTVLNSTAGEVRIGYSDANGEHTVFLLTLDTGTGHFDFTQFEPIDHPIASVIEDNVYLSFNAGSITDADGDTTDAVIKIQVNDDVPETGVTYTNVAAEETGPGPEPELRTSIIPLVNYGQVDEDYLSHGGNKDGDNNPSGASSDPARGDTQGYTVVTGEIGSATEYGADGPEGTPGEKYALSALTEDAAFTDAEGNQLKSHGNLLVVLTSEDGLLEIGYRNGADPETVVFTLKMTGDTEFEFELKGPLDHPQANGDTAEQDIVLAFGADNGTTDKDSDPAARIVIHVNDDAPKLNGIDYYNFVDISGEDPIQSSGPGLIDEDHINLLTAGENLDLDNDPSGHENADRGDTLGGYLSTGVINIDFGADGKADNAFALAGYKDGSTFQDADGNTYQSHGHTLTVLDHDANHVTVGYKDGGDSTTVFVFSVNNDGAFSLAFQEPLDHPGHKPLEDSLPLAFNVTASDYDGDTIDTKIAFQVNDDAPGKAEVSFSEGEYIPEENFSYGTIDEDWIVDQFGKVLGNQDKDYADEYPDGPGKGSVDIQVTVPFGADGPAEHPYSLELLDEGKTWLSSGQAVYSKFDPAPWDQPAPAISDLKPLVVLSSTADELVVGHENGSVVVRVTLDQDTGKATMTLYQGIDQQEYVDHGKTTNETSIFLGFNVIATDFDGDTTTKEVLVKVNDDRPDGKPDDGYVPAYIPGVDNPTGLGNLFANDHGTADGVRVTKFNGIEMTDGQVSFEAKDFEGTVIGKMIVTDDGLWNFVAYKTNKSAIGFYYDYEAVDGDGDKLTSSIIVHLPAPATHQPGPDASYDYTSTLIAGTFTPDESAGGVYAMTGDHYTTYHISDPYGGNAIYTGAGNDYIDVTGSEGETVNGYLGDDVIKGGNGNDSLNGYVGDDTIYGGGGDDEIYGSGGHDAMHGGLGDDTFLDVDEADFEGVNLLDGKHSIIGGGGGLDTDTVELYRFTSFGNNQAKYLEDIEVLAFKSKDPNTNNEPLINKGTSVTLSYIAVYQMTDPGGNHTLTIHADGPGIGADQVNLQNAAGQKWVFEGSDGTYDTYKAGEGDDEVTVHIDHGTSVQIIPGLATHEPAAKYDQDVATDHGYAGSAFDTDNFHVVATTGGQDINTGSGDDYIEIIGDQGTKVFAYSGDNIVRGGGGDDELNTYFGDDTIYGGGGNDLIFGSAGHDAMHGGAGNDTFIDVDTDDFTGTNRLDGIHTIIGGEGTDTVELYRFATFDSNQAHYMSEIEVLAFKSDNPAINNEPLINKGTTVTLNYDAVYGITEVGGLHTLTIHADAAGAIGADSIQLQNTAGKEWQDAGVAGAYHTFTAGTGADQVTVHVDKDAATNIVP